MFSPYKNHRIPNEVVRQVIEALRTGELKPGDQLPTERELVGLMGISRPSVREGLGVLALCGIVDSVQGRGTFICDTLPSLDSPFFAAIETNADPFHIIESRLVLESAVAELAATRIEDDAIERLKETIAGLTSAEDIDTVIKWDATFHRLIGEATENPVLGQMVAELTEKMEEQLWRTLDIRALSNPYERDQTRREHEQVVAALEARSPREARKTIREHLTAVEERFRRCLEEGVADSEDNAV